MPSKWRLWLTRLTHMLWFRAALYCVFGGLTALLGAVFKGVIPSGLAGQIGADSVGNLLTILASSMLAVTTFSLSAMISSYEAAGSHATPRASALLIQDSTTQRALAGFIGVFLFSIVGLVALSSGIYGDSGRIILFGATILVILAIVTTLLRWIDQLAHLGRVPETISRVERSTEEALQRLAGAPFRHANPWRRPPDDARAVYSRSIGYLTYVDLGALQQLADDHGTRVWAAGVPGDFVAPDVPVAWIETTLDDDEQARLQDAFVVDRARDFAHDPRYGLTVLAEIAQRALSPGINDPGTAISVITAVTRLLCGWAHTRQCASRTEMRHPRVFVRQPSERDFFDDAFAPLARDGAGLVEIGVRLQKSLGTLGHLGFAPFREPAADYARRALELAERKLQLEDERAHLRALYQRGTDTR